MLLFITAIFTMLSISVKARGSSSSPTNRQLRQQIQHMSLSEKIGQMYVVSSTNDPVELDEDLKTYHFGGIVLFAQDFAGQDRVSFTKRMTEYQRAADLPLLIGTDQEGGTVSRLNAGPQLTGAETFPSPSQIYQQYGLNGNEDLTAKTARLLRGLGVNWNFSPVVDVTGDHNSFIYDRTLGQGYGETAAYAVRSVRGMQRENVGATLKHFPGYGSTADTHTGLATTSRPLSAFMRDDFLPFKAGIRAGADSIMVAHIIARKIDPRFPASLSPRIHRLLREELHFKGVVVSDDLSMGAIKDFAQKENVSADVLAVKAGNDMILSNNYATGIPAIKNAVKKGYLSEKQIDHSIYRILRMKRSLNLLKIGHKVSGTTDNY